MHIFLLAYMIPMVFFTLSSTLSLYIILVCSLIGRISPVEPWKFPCRNFIPPGKKYYIRLTGVYVTSKLANIVHWCMTLRALFITLLIVSRKLPVFLFLSSFSSVDPLSILWTINNCAFEVIIKCSVGIFLML